MSPTRCAAFRTAPTATRSTISRVATRMLLARSGQTEITWLARCPATLEDFRAFLMELFTPLGVPPDELSFFVSRLLIVATSCPERRLAEYRKHRMVGLHCGDEDVEGLPGISGARPHALAGRHARRREQHADGRLHSTAASVWPDLPGSRLRSSAVGSDQRRLDPPLDSSIWRNSVWNSIPEPEWSESKRMVRE